MKVAVFSTKNYERDFFESINQNYNHELTFFESHLTPEMCPVTENFPAVCVFVNDLLKKEIVESLAVQGVKLIALRCAGFNNVDINTAARLGVTVVRVPAYSPFAVAEHTVSLMLSLNRKIHKAYARVREGNFSLDGLLGFDMAGKTVGIIGTGKIGTVLAKIMAGFGCKILAYDTFQNQECIGSGVNYVSLPELYAASDIITLHCPLTPETMHLIGEPALALMKDGVMLINTSRGALIDTQKVIDALKSGKIGYLGLDVYEEEADLFFEDQSGKVLQDDIFARLLTFPNVIITGHQAFFTRNALENIVRTTLENISRFEQGEPVNVVNDV
jgi:D-lactate dehydrogenase